MSKEYIVDFEEWFVTAETGDDAYDKVEERLCDGDLPKVSSVEEK